MKVSNKLYPSDEQMQGFFEGDVDTPISMVNLLKFKKHAEYEDGRNTQLSGAEAYAIYAEEIKVHLKKVGAKLTEMSKEQSDYIGVEQQGPFKKETYRY